MAKSALAHMSVRSSRAAADRCLGQSYAAFSAKEISVRREMAEFARKACES